MKTRAPRQNTKRNGQSTSVASVAVATRRWSGGPPPSIRSSNLGSRQVDELKAVSRSGLWSLQLFLFISSVAFLVRDFDIYATFPESVLQILGCAPPAFLVQVALAGYVFTVIVPLLINMQMGSQPAFNRWHLLYRAAFYLFFLSSNSLTAQFMVVFATCCILYLLEQVSVCLSLHRVQQGDSQPA